MLLNLTIPPDSFGRLEDTDNRWYEIDSIREAVRPILTSLAARYLLLEKHKSSNKPLDGVAKFHMKNGAEASARTGRASRLVTLLFCSSLGLRAVLQAIT